MRKIKEVLRLKFEADLSHDRIAAATGVSKGAATKYVRRAREVGLGWPLPAAMDDGKLEALLFPRAAPLVARHAEPDFAHLHQELKRKGVTLQLLWEEYTVAHPGHAYRYSQFCLLFKRFRGSLKRSMRQVHHAGDKLFIDYSGTTASIINGITGEIRRAEIFVAVLGASSYVYAEATWSQQLPDWIAAHVRCFEFMAAVPALLVPDNLKSAINAACRYEPEANSTYGDLARHYATAILPARPYKPRDKAAVEASVLLVQRWILARLRHRQFFSLEELNAAIRALVIDLNQRPFKKLEGSRQSAFEAIDRPAMKPLPATRYEFAEWKRAIVNIDYHVDADGHYYSVPHRLVKQKVDVLVFAHGDASARNRKQREQRMCARCCAAVTPPSPSTCRRRTANTCNGRRDHCSRGDSVSVRPPAPSCSGSSITVRILSRVIALASASSTSPSTAARNGWKQLASGH